MKTNVIGYRSLVVESIIRRKIAAGPATRLGTGRPLPQEVPMADLCLLFSDLWSLISGCLLSTLLPYASRPPPYTSKLKASLSRIQSPKWREMSYP